MNADERGCFFKSAGGRHASSRSGKHGERPMRLAVLRRSGPSTAPHFLHHLRLSAFICGIILTLMLLSACRTERVTSSDGRPLPPRARAVLAAPVTARAERMVFMVGGKPEDTNRSGYPDLISATVGLFSSSHPMAIRKDGEFLFELYPQGQAYDPSAEPIMTWRITSEQMERAQGEAQWGPSYHFRLSLLDRGPRGDHLSLAAADLRATFLPADGGSPVRNDGVRSIQIGRR